MKEFENHIDACRFALENHSGDIVEIGAGLGESTKHFLALAKEFDRKVIVIDPFESGWKDMPESYGKPYPLEGFHANVKENKDRLIIHQRSSLCKTSHDLCLNTNIAFAFVDGLQLKGAILNDLYIVDHAFLICVDDVDRETEESQVPSTLATYRYSTDKIINKQGKWAFIK